MAQEAQKNEWLNVFRYIPESVDEMVSRRKERGLFDFTAKCRSVSCYTKYTDIVLQHYGERRKGDKLTTV